MKRRNMDLAVGGSILIALIILITGVLWLKETSVSRKVVSYAVLFPNVGTLQVGDPVMVNGVTNGSVGKIFLRGADVAVIVNVDNSIPITDSSLFVVQNIGLMGERGIGIQLSSSGKAIKPSTKQDTTFIQGRFDTGIAEAMGMMGTVLTEVQSLAVNVNGIVNKTVGDTTFLTMFQSITKRLDSLLFTTEELIYKNKPVLDKSLQNVNEISLQLKDLVNRNGHRLDTVVTTGEMLSKNSLQIVRRLDSITAITQTMLNDIRSGQGALGKMYKDEMLYSDVKTTLANLDTLLNQVNKDALKLRLRFW